MAKKQVSTDDLISVIIKGMDDVKGENIQLLDLREIENTVCDYFIICSGNSNTQVNAISGSIQKVVSKQLKDKPWHIEGQAVRPDHRMVAHTGFLTVARFIGDVQ